MKKTIIALFLVLLTLGLCVSCDASVDKKLLGGASNGLAIINIYRNNDLSTPYKTIRTSAGQTWGSLIYSDHPSGIALASIFVTCDGKYVYNSLTFIGGNQVEHTDTINAGTTNFYISAS